MSRRVSRRRVTWAAGTVALLLVGIVLVRGGLALGRLRQLQVTAVDRDVVTLCSQAGPALGDAMPLLVPLHLASLAPSASARAWGQVPALADAARHACDAARVSAPLLVEVAAAGGGTRPVGAVLLDALPRVSGDLPRAGASLRSAVGALDRVDPATLRADERLAPLARLVEQMRQQREALLTAAEVAPSLPTALPLLLGHDRPRTYLLLGQNNEESRATGGFIGTIGLIRVAGGQVTASDVRSSYQWDRPDVPKLHPPQPLQRYMNFAGWYLRDANWWMDYRRTVSQVLLMWEHEHGSSAEIDGVIAIDRGALDDLLRAVGGVDVPELGGLVTASNVGDVLDARRRQPHADYQAVKTEALSALNRAVVRKVMEARGPDLLKLLATVAQSADGRSVLAWFREPAVQAVVASQRWDGRIDPPAGDIVGVVETTMSYGKISPFIDRQAGYARDGTGTASINLQYSNRFVPQTGGSFDPLIDGLWWDWRASAFRREPGLWVGYVRVIAPPGARLLSAAGWDDTPDTSIEGPVTVFGAPVIVRPGTSRTVSLRYSNPAPPGSPTVVHHQPGVAPVLATARGTAPRANSTPTTRLTDERAAKPGPSGG